MTSRLVMERFAPADEMRRTFIPEDTGRVKLKFLDDGVNSLHRLQSKYRVNAAVTGSGRVPAVGVWVPNIGLGP
jgi:hypothetical protein